LKGLGSQTKLSFLLWLLARDKLQTLLQWRRGRLGPLSLVAIASPSQIRLRQMITESSRGKTIRKELT
jgi:hypothetical protein